MLKYVSYQIICIYKNLNALALWFRQTYRIIKKIILILLTEVNTISGRKINKFEDGS